MFYHEMQRRFEMIYEHVNFRFGDNFRGMPRCDRNGLGGTKFNIQNLDNTLVDIIMTKKQFQAYKGVIKSTLRQVIRFVTDYL